MNSAGRFAVAWVDGNNASNATARAFTTQPPPPPPACPTGVPTLLTPVAGSTVPNPVTFSWSKVTNATTYSLYVGVNGAAPTLLNQDSTTSFTTTLGAGPVVWYVFVNGAAGCGSRVSRTGTFNAGEPPPPPPGCSQLPAPIPSLVAEATTGQTYTFSWTAVDGATGYEAQESTSASFSNIQVQDFVVSATQLEFQHAGLTAPTAYFYRVRALCKEGGAGPYSTVIRVVGLPLPMPSATNPQIVTEFDNTNPVDTFLFIPGFGSGAKVSPQAASFTVTSNEPWLTVSPASGPLPSTGATVKLTADPKMLDFGASSATVVVTRNDGLAKSVFGTTTTSVPVSVSLVSPVTPLGKGSIPPGNALIIPAVANVTGATQKWLSDVKLSNTAGQPINYQLTFTATGADGAQSGKRTSYTLKAGQSVAMDDIVRQWFGFGDLADGTNGYLEVRPLNFNGKEGSEAEATALAATVAVSRTYTRDQNSLASFGQFVPSTAFSQFINRQVQGALLSMQQISQTSSLRSNFGLVEGSGKGVNVLLTVYDNLGAKVGEFPVSLLGNEHKQLNSMLAANGITLNDGRIEAKVTSGDGAITAYASVIAAGTGDPIFVQGMDPAKISSSKYVLPGLADLHAGSAIWRSDVRIFNGGTQSQMVDLYFYPQGSTTAKGPVPVIVGPGQVKVLQGVVEQLFGLQNTGGAMQIVTAQTSSLLTTAETYDTANPAGKYGQFIAGITPDQAIGSADRALQVLQIEDSAQFRTNLGLVELTGKPVTVQVQLIVPNSLVAPIQNVQLGANEFRQLNGVARSMAGKDVYNARFSVKVLSGEGKITTYASVVDNKTSDANYVPGQ
jgi:hypothetical protein